MAYYINDNFDKIYNRQGVKLINDYLSSDAEVIIEMRYIGTNDEVILIQSLSSITGHDERSKHYNTISFYTHIKQIMVNPHYVSGKNVTEDIVNFIESLPNILRGKKIETIINNI